MTELGVFSVMWSEHCSYKSSRVHLKRLPLSDVMREQFQFAHPSDSAEDVPTDDFRIQSAGGACS
jgi:phosphoribosylformylglycinamidine (FGAM) synthase-like enzyme